MVRLALPTYAFVDACRGAYRTRRSRRHRPYRGAPAVCRYLRQALYSRSPRSERHATVIDSILRRILFTGVRNTALVDLAPSSSWGFSGWLNPKVRRIGGV